jgi:surface antigen/peptidoglycan hydrolase CwlO-like protein
MVLFIKVLMAKTNMPKIKKVTAIFRSKLASVGVLGIGVLLVVGLSVMPHIVRADSIGDQINQLQQENSNNRNTVAQLRNEALSYQDAIARLQSQISLLQGQINDNLAKQTDLQARIEQGQRDLEHQQKVLGENIKMMYLEGQISTLEILATSKDLSEFVDKAEYRNAVKSKIQTTLQRIAFLQNQMKEQKVQVETLLKEQQSSQQALNASRSEQANLLAYNQTQQSDFNARTKANQSKIDALIAQQRRANESASPGGYFFLRFPGGAASVNGENYKYANAGFGMSTAPGCVDNDGPDEWGYCTRQCVSYAAWAVEASGRHAPRYYGNARDWVSAARRDGIPIYSTPQPGDVAISTAGTWGHAMYVEGVEGNSIWVSQYNQQLTGRYSTQWRVYR